jgi:acetyl esterase
MSIEQSTAPVHRPGRLGDPEMCPGTDPRADPRMVAAMRGLGMDALAPPLPIGVETPPTESLPVLSATELQFEALYGAVFDGLPAVAGVTRETVTIDGADGHQIPLYVHRPEREDRDTLPWLLHLHGGGMAILRGANAGYTHWRDLLAAGGVNVVGVEFRNAAGALGPHPFPAGLDDCQAGFDWTFAQTGAPVIVSGESGGGNLSLALALRANRDGWIERIAGVYALCPYISGAYVDLPPTLPSLAENDGYFISCALLAPLARAYDPDGAHTADATCWPLAATESELRGLPPHVISVNELDPLRDEGLAYLRALQAAGVGAIGRIVPGTCHGGDMLFMGAMPDVAAATLRDIAGFIGAL